MAISGAVAQFPVGKISDKFDRRKVIIFSTTFGAAFFAIITILVSRQMYLPEGLATSKTLVLYIFYFFSFLQLTNVFNNFSTYK